MICPSCGGIHAETIIEAAHGQRYIRCPLCGDQVFRAHFNNPPIDWRLVELPKKRRRKGRR